jgi:superfamily II DNA or RNA helicase
VPQTPSTARRRFNGAERTALYLAANGLCTRCGTELSAGWHADHVKPWSVGGNTDVMNGQALCLTCNLRKGDTYVELRQWQEDALRTFLARRNDFLAVATPGAGKTTFALEATRALWELNEISFVIVVVPTSHLRQQWAKAAARAGFQLDHSFVNANNRPASDYDGVVVTYQTVAASPLLWRKLACDPRRPALVIMDEVHHAGDADHLSWGSALGEAFTQSSRRLLLSGTPFRTDGNKIPFVRYDVAGRAEPDINYDYGSALQDRNVVRQVAFPAMDGEARWRYASEHPMTQKLSETDQSTIAAALKAALDPAGDWIPSVLRRANDELSLMRQDVPDTGGLVVAPDQAHAQAYAEILRRSTQEEVALAISDDPAASKVIEEYARGSARWIVAVQMVSEGVDIPRLGLVVYASRIRTEMFFRQVVGRCVRLRGADDETCARVFVPTVQALLAFAADIEKTVNAVIAEEESSVRRNQAAEGNGDPLDRTVRVVEVIGSSAAEHQFTVSGGASYAEEELLHARRLGIQAGLPPSTEPAVLAQFLRLAGARNPGSPSEPAERVLEQTLSERKDELRNLIKRKVGLLHKLTRKPHSHIHADMNRALSERSITDALEEGLNKRLVLLDQWIEEARRIEEMRNAAGAGAWS